MSNIPFKNNYHAKGHVVSSQSQTDYILCHISVDMAIFCRHHLHKHFFSAMR